MIFRKHYDLKDKHAFLSPSNHHWTNYDEQKLVMTYKNHLAVKRGTRLHEIACSLIREGINLPKNRGKNYNSFNSHVNDAITMNLIPEQPLYFSEFCFGTSDAIQFDGEILRIHDLKTGTTPASFTQLEVYAALFCLEYDISPNDIEIELRIYQNNDCLVSKPDASSISKKMDTIVVFSDILGQLEEGEEK